VPLVDRKIKSAYTLEQHAGLITWLYIVDATQSATGHIGTCGQVNAARARQLNNELECGEGIVS
jgi:hypothetical protein